MSSHSVHREWNFGDPIPEELADEIVECVAMNLRLNSGCFAVLCPADSLVHNCEQAVRHERQGGVFDWKFDEAPEGLETIITQAMEELRSKGLCEPVPQEPADTEAKPHSEL